MTLDYLDNINTYGENMVRLYEFNMTEADLLRQAIVETIITNHEPLDLSTTFIVSRNCTLTLRIATENIGIETADKKAFFCDLTLKGYEHMIYLLSPFCVNKTKGFQWLYDLDNINDFLFSPDGTW